MRLSSIITELFETEAPIEWDIDDNHWMGTFYIGDKQYRIIIMEKIYPDSTWEINFGLVNNNYTRYGITGTGNASSVFSIVMSAIKVWIDAVNPKTFYVTAREPSRQKLYARLMRLLPKEWQWKQIHDTFIASKDAEHLAFLYDNFGGNEI